LAYDQLQTDPNRGPLINKRATASKTNIKPNLSSLIKNCDIIISSVTANAALEVSNEAKKYLHMGQFFLDINSVSPKIKKKMAIIIQEKGNASFIEAAVMAAIPPLKNKVPILICGENVLQFMKKMEAFNFNFTNVGQNFGQASATKMFRSIIIKGIEAILQESMLAASVYGVSDVVLNSIEATHPGINWKNLTTYLLGRTALHGQRRVFEVREASKTLKELGIKPIITEAIAERIGVGVTSGLKETFGNKANVDAGDLIIVERGTSLYKSACS